MSIPRKIPRIIGRSLYEAYKDYNKQLSNYFTKNGHDEITSSNYQYLYIIHILNKYEQIATVTGISNRLGVKKSAVVQMLSNLLKSSYIIKKDNLNDKRSFSLELTEKGDEIIRLEEFYSNSYLEYFYDALTLDEQQTLENIARKIAAKMEGGSPSI